MHTPTKTQPYIMHTYVNSLIHSHSHTKKLTNTFMERHTNTYIHTQKKREKEAEKE